LRNLANAREVSAGREKPFAARSRVGHRLEVQIGDVAHIDTAKPEIGAARQGAVHETLYEHDRSRIVRSKDRPENADRVDHGQLQPAPLPRYEIPSRALGDRLRFLIGLQSRILEIRPILFRERGGPALRGAVPDRREGRGHDHALDAGVPRGPQQAQRPVSGRSDLKAMRRRRIPCAQHPMTQSGGSSAP
jgi:hypothetical protein